MYYYLSSIKPSEKECENIIKIHVVYDSFMCNALHPKSFQVYSNMNFFCLGFFFLLHVIVIINDVCFLLSSIFQGIQQLRKRLRESICLDEAAKHQLLTCVDLDGYCFGLLLECQKRCRINSF